MQPEKAWNVPNSTWALFANIQRVILALPKTIETPAYVVGTEVSNNIAVAHVVPNCHIVARALAAVFPVVVHDGEVRLVDCHGKVQCHKHSWLTIVGDDSGVIIDPWPLGVLSGPAIFMQDYAQHFGPECSYLQHRTEQFKSQLESTISTLKKVSN